MPFAAALSGNTEITARSKATLGSHRIQRRRVLIFMNSISDSCRPIPTFLRGPPAPETKRESRIMIGRPSVLVSGLACLRLVRRHVRIQQRAADLRFFQVQLALTSASNPYPLHYCHGGVVMARFALLLLRLGGIWVAYFGRSNSDF